jgi:hypothetical protein
MATSHKAGITRKRAAFYAYLHFFGIHHVPGGQINCVIVILELHKNEGTRHGDEDRDKGTGTGTGIGTDTYERCTSISR